MEEPADVPEEEEEEEESKDSTPAWRRDSAETVFHDEDGTGPVKDWRDSAVAQTAGRKSAVEVWDQTGDVSGFVTAEDVPSEMGAFATEVSALEAETLTAQAPHASAAVEDSSAQAQVEKSEEPAVAAGEGEVATVADEEREPESQPTEFVHSTVETVETAREPERSVAEPEAEPVAAAAASETESEESATVARVEEKSETVASTTSPTSSTTESWFSRPASPWDAESSRKDSLANSWDTARVATDSGAAETEPSAKTSNGESTPEEAAAVLSDEPAVDSSRDSGAAEQIASVVASETVSASGVRTQAEMDELVARVLAKISPEVLHAAAMEMLKPVVTALIENEVKEKK